VIRALLSVCGQDVLLDSQSNRASIISIAESFDVPILPGIFGSVGALFILARDEGDPESPQMVVRVGLVGRPPQELPVAIDFQHKMTVRVIVRMSGLLVPAPGVLRVALAHVGEGEAIGHWDMAVNLVAPAAVAAAVQ